MISSKKLVKMAQKWRNLVIVNRKRIIFSKTTSGVDNEDCSTLSAVKGYVIFYSADKKRFAIPLAYLNNGVFRELLSMAEDEYGLPSDGPIVFPCDADFMFYVMSLLEKHMTKDLEKALLMTIRNSHCSVSSCINDRQSNLHLLKCVY